MGRGVITVLPPLLSIPPDVVSAADYARRAPDHLDPAAWAYLAGGSGDEVTLRENTAAFEALKLMPRVLSDVRGGHTRLELFGQPMANPFILAPVGWQKLFHQEAELASAQAAAVMEAVFAVSTYATTAIEVIATQSPIAPWFQVYFQPEREDTERLVRRAEQVGCRVLIVTVDAPVNGPRNREQQAGFALPPGMRAANLPFRANERKAPHGVFDAAMAKAPTWADVAWLCGLTRLPVVVKGILHPDDAARALDSGAAGIAVSNHGGRVLDTVPAAIHALPAIARRVNGAAPILFDSGIRRGTDAFKAIALGAQAVMVGRPYVHALSVAGALGVAHLIRTLREELELTMALMGCATLSDISGEHLFPAI
jgi:4-hydroxymandelate oxidase